MEAEVRYALAGYLTSMADDELLLGHRDSEWCGRAPILEEDIAFANIALDEIGHALIWYALLADLVGEDREAYPDRMAFHRPVEAFLNAELVVLPKGDWAMTILRQYLFDEFESVRLGRLIESQYRPLAEAAVKLRKEEIYHARHSVAWVKRLGLGTEESRRRMQAALDTLWSYGVGLFSPVEGEEILVADGIAPAGGEVRAQWEGKVRALFSEVGLEIPEAVQEQAPGRGGTGPHLRELLSEMQSVARLHPDARW